MGSSGGGRAGGEGSLKGLHSPSLFTAPRGDREGGGVDRGMDRNACREEEKNILQQQNSSSRWTAPYCGSVCIFSVDCSALDMLLM